MPSSLCCCDFVFTGAKRPPNPSLAGLSAEVIVVIRGERGNYNSRRVARVPRRVVVIQDEWLQLG